MTRHFTRCDISLPRPALHRLSLGAALLAHALCFAGLAHAEPTQTDAAPPQPVATPAESPPPAADAAPATVPSPRPPTTKNGKAAQPPKAATPPPPAEPVKPGKSSMPAEARPHDLAAGLAHLGLKLLDNAAPQENAVNAPFGVANALGLVQLATRGPAAQEIGSLFGGANALGQDLPALLKQLKANDSPLIAANRIFLNQKFAAHVEAAFNQAAHSRYDAEGVAIDMQAQGAEAEVNRWVAEKTQDHIQSILPPGTLDTDSRAVLTNALYFKGQWQTPFSPGKTQPLPFFAESAGPEGIPVPTMSGKQTLMSATVEGYRIYQIPYAGGDFALTLIPAPEGKTLHQTEKDLHAKSWAQYAQALKPQTCLVELPKFSIAPQPGSLKKALQNLGVKAVFGKGADFTPFAGKAGGNIQLSDVLHAAGIVVDESGTEAASATAAVAVAKSFSPKTETCSINRPFVFALVHTPSHTPIFMGRVSKPAP